MPHPDDRPIRIFLSYAPSDQALKDDLEKHLSILQRLGMVEAWSMDRVPAGSEWRQESKKALEQADVALLLVSADYFDFLLDVDLVAALDRRGRTGMTVIPVLLRSCLWDEHPWLKTLKPVPASGKAIAAYDGDARDQAMTEVAKEVARLARTLQSSTGKSAAKEPELLDPGRRPGRAQATQAETQAFFEQYGKTQYVKQAKAMEAKHMLGAIARAVSAYALREAVRGEPPRLPPSAPLTPPEVPRGVKAVPDETTWNHPTWQAMHFSIIGPVYHSYEVITTPGGRSSLIRAHGDLDGQNKITIFERSINIDPHGNIMTSPDLITREEFK